MSEEPRRILVLQKEADYRAETYFYTMIQTSNREDFIGFFDVSAHGIRHSSRYPMSKWDTLKRQKINRKGYRVSRELSMDDSSVYLYSHVNRFSTRPRPEPVIILDIDTMHDSITITIDQEFNESDDNFIRIGTQHLVPIGDFFDSFSNKMRYPKMYNNHCAYMENTSDGNSDPEEGKLPGNPALQPRS